MAEYMSFFADQESRSERPKLLLVEDNKVALFTLENMIQQAHWTFLSVMDGESALQLLEQHSFDLIITDLGLPGLSGIELTEKIRAKEAEENLFAIPIIGLTAHSEDSIKKQCKVAGMNEVFTKPMTIDGLIWIKNTFLSGFAKIS